MLTFPEEDLPASEQLQRDHFGMHRFEWPQAGGAVEFALTHGDMIRLLRDSGFEIEDLVEVRAPEGAEAPTDPLATPEWVGRRDGRSRRRGRHGRSPDRGAALRSSDRERGGDHMRAFNPSGVAGPFGTYSQGVEVEGPVTLLFGAGQVGVDTDGRIGQDIEEQCRLLWRNVGEVLAGARMGISDIVQLNMLMVGREDLPTARAVREEVLGDHRPASTLMLVAGLAHPDWLIEVDFVAARPAD